MPTTVYVPHANTSVDFPDTWTPDQIQAHLDESQFNQDVANYNPTVALSRYMGNAALQAQYTPRSTLPAVSGKNVYGLGVEGTQQVLGAVQQDNVQQERERQAQLAQIEQSQRQHELEAARIKHDSMALKNQMAIAKYRADLQAHTEAMKEAARTGAPYTLAPGAKRMDSEGKVIAENQKTDATKPIYRQTADGWVDLRDPLNEDGTPKVVAPLAPAYMNVAPGGTVLDKHNPGAGPVYSAPDRPPKKQLVKGQNGEQSIYDPATQTVTPLNPNEVEYNKVLKDVDRIARVNGGLIPNKQDLYNALVAGGHKGPEALRAADEFGAEASTKTAAQPSDGWHLPTWLGGAPSPAPAAPVKIPQGIVQPIQDPSNPQKQMVTPDGGKAVVDQAGQAFLFYDDGRKVELNLDMAPVQAPAGQPTAPGTASAGTKMKYNPATGQVE